MSEVVSGKNLTTIVLDEEEVNALRSCLRTLDALASGYESDKFIDVVEINQGLCNKLFDLFGAIEVGGEAR
jgi:hypothetical protein